ncbi:unnamed protein product [Prorocentrum cordatum]|uniref:Uncharacterized protein n=1 Tax=Prorocentrum cordatum TaxID=2364126 RepID=A0ABN9YE34_9DINO|nr:unnamed protein product [Polarella glacialis]
MRSRAAWPAARALCCGGRPAARSAAAASSSRAGEQQDHERTKSTGAIAGEDLEVALRSLGLDASRSEALGLLKDARVSANAFASIVANEFPPCAGAEGSGAAFGLFAPGATGLITAPDLRVVVNHLGDRLSAEVLDEISRLAEEEARRRRLEPAAWPPHEWGGATGAVLEQALDSTSVTQGVDLPAHMLEEGDRTSHGLIPSVGGRRTGYGYGCGLSDPKGGIPFERGPPSDNTHP